MTEKQKPAKRTKGIGDTLFPRIRRLLLTRFFSAPERRYYAGELARLIGAAQPPVRQELRKLTDIGVLNSVREGPHDYYWANQACMIYDELRTIMIKTFGVADLIRSALEPHAHQIKVAFLYGSIAGGTDTAKSDIDLLVIGSISFRELTVALQGSESQLGRPVNPSVYSEKDFANKLGTKNHFTRSLLTTEKIFVHGDNDAFGRLAEQRVDQERTDESG